MICPNCGRPVPQAPRPGAGRKPVLRPCKQCGVKMGTIEGFIAKFGNRTDKVKRACRSQ